MWWNLLSSAWACTVALDDPSSFTLVTTTPTFRWTTDCPKVRLAIKPAGSGASSVFVSGDLIASEFTLDPLVFDGLSAGRYRWYVRTPKNGSVSRPFDVDHDRDLDGFPESVDCDDLDPAIFPGAMERCDGVDEDCSGAVDDGAVGARAVGAGGMRVLDDPNAAITVHDEDLFVCAGTTWTGSVTLRGLSSASGDATLDSVSFLDGVATVTDLTVGLALMQSAASANLTGVAARTLSGSGDLVLTDSSVEGGNTIFWTGGTVELVRTDVVASGVAANLTHATLVCTDSSLVSTGFRTVYMNHGSTFVLDHCDMESTFDPQIDIQILHSGQPAQHFVVGTDGVGSCDADTFDCGAAPIPTAAIAPVPVTASPLVVDLGRPGEELRLESATFRARATTPGATCDVAPSFVRGGATESVGATVTVGNAATDVALAITRSLSPLPLVDHVVRLDFVCTSGGLEVDLGDRADDSFVGTTDRIPTLVVTRF